MSELGVYLVGGSKAYGSGKVVSFLRDGLKNRGILRGFIETQGARGEIFAKLFAIPRGAEVLYQPSICFPAFARDVLLISVMRLRGLSVAHILLVDVVFRNPLLRNGMLRRIFFGRSTVLGLAEFSQPVARASRVTPYFDVSSMSRFPSMALQAPIVAIHLGYRNEMKGWDDLRSQLSAEEHPLKVVAIGGSVTAVEAEAAAPVQLLPGASTDEIETSLKSIVEENFPVYVFLSREDFAPLMVLEAGFWGLPLVTLRGTRAEGIMSRMLPGDCYVIVDSLKSIPERRDDLIAARAQMLRHLEDITSDRLLDDIVSHLQSAGAACEPDRIQAH